jgi:hypothetical protein
MMQERERQVSQDVGERWLTGAEQIEGRAETARQSELQRKWQTGERTGGEEAQRALASDKAYYQSYLQDQIQAGRLTEQQAAQEFEAYAMQADQQFAYSQMMSQQQYGYGMQNLQGEWDAYGQTLGFQNQAGLLGMQQGYGWQLSQSDQMFRQGMAEYGWQIEQAQQSFQLLLQKHDIASGYKLQGMANDMSWVDYVNMGINVVDAVIPG